MHTINHEYLATHPVDKPARFTLSAPVPERFKVPHDADGNPSEISVAITGPTYKDALNALSQFQDQDQLAIMMHGLMSTYTGNDDLRGDELEACFKKVETPAPVHTFSLGLTDANNRESEVEFELTSPSIQAAASILTYLSKPKNLLNLAISLQSDNDDDSFDDD